MTKKRLIIVLEGYLDGAKRTQKESGYSYIWKTASKTERMAFDAGAVWLAEFAIRLLKGDEPINLTIRK